MRRRSMGRQIAEWIREHRDAIIAVAAVVIVYGIMFAMGITCPIKAATGISCPGCGMTRAWLSVLRLDPAAAFRYHPLFILPPLWLAAWYYREKHPAIYNAVSVAALAALLAVYVCRMMDPADSIVVFAPEEGILFRGLDLFLLLHLHPCQ